MVELSSRYNTFKRLKIRSQKIIVLGILVEKFQKKDSVRWKIYRFESGIWKMRSKKSHINKFWK